MALDENLINQIDKMTKDQALAHVKSVISATIEMRNRYETAMIDQPGVTLYDNLWANDNAQILKLKRLLYEITQEV